MPSIVRFVVGPSASVGGGASICARAAACAAASIRRRHAEHRSLRGRGHRFLWLSVCDVGLGRRGGRLSRGALRRLRRAGRRGERRRHAEHRLLDGPLRGRRTRIRGVAPLGLPASAEPERRQRSSRREPRSQRGSPRRLPRALPSSPSASREPCVSVARPSPRRSARAATAPRARALPAAEPRPALPRSLRSGPRHTRRRTARSGGSPLHNAGTVSAPSSAGYLSSPPTPSRPRFC